MDLKNQLSMAMTQIEMQNRLLNYEKERREDERIQFKLLVSLLSESIKKPAPTPPPIYIKNKPVNTASSHSCSHIHLDVDLETIGQAMAESPENMDKVIAALQEEIGRFKEEMSEDNKKSTRTILSMMRRESADGVTGLLARLDNILCSSVGSAVWQGSCFLAAKAMGLM
ncbi:hypothetical protein Dalk_4944 [Desulfatibacillum aliphaticivorans]|uniref:Uncharacterized protein n=1 Tax=Desulfatibacillum aliphaticivorans TaxID=218208 RepID=B8FDI5_DESAL|nr:hypothetical protein [Desulfatibacillum aliphaticivorans]ACL06616.1 hypothetical protein Dalk_4944 [Desulfatibacillum aliphaticivorans]